jgi:hypothetical protein
MPVRTIRKGASKRAKHKHASRVISEFSRGRTYKKTARKFGKARARAQAIAVGLKSGRLSRRKKKG